LLDAAFALVAEQGYRGMTVRKVSERAGISSKTFYDLFGDREDCFLAAFDYAIEELAAVVTPAYEARRDWAGGVRAGLAALLGFLDREPALRRLVFVEALGGGPRVLARRAQLLGELAEVIDRGRVDMRTAGGLPPLTAEGLVGAAFGVIHARLVERPTEPLVGLTNALMATIVLPYRGRTVAARELERPTIEPAVRDSEEAPGSALGSVAPLDFRLTVRTYAALAAVFEHPGVCNREVSELVRVSDQGQISRLMARLLEQGLLQNSGGHGQGAPKAWRLTPHGEEVVQANRPLGEGAT
jgi:AcrR family transcriptional regulator